METIKKLKNITIFIFIIGLIASLILIKYFSNKIEPSLTKYAESETKRIITLIINNSIRNQISNQIDTSSIIITKTDDNQNITTIDFNTQNVNKILSLITSTIEKNLKLVETGNVNKLNVDLTEVSDIDYQQIKGGIVYSIPVGNVNNSFLLNNIYPQIPIKFTMSGDVISNIDSQVKEYGINNALIEVNAKVSVSMLISMPFVTKEINVNTSIPLIMKIIQGNIPDYYTGTISPSKDSNNQKNN